MMEAICSASVKENAAQLKGIKGNVESAAASACLMKWQRVTTACCLNHREIETANCGDQLKMKNTQNIDTVTAKKDANWAKINNFQGQNPEKSRVVILAHRFPVLGTVENHLIARDLSTANQALTQEREFIT